MKKVFIFLSIIAFVGCTAPNAQVSRIGTAGDGGSVGVGSQASVDIIVALDEAWKKYDFKAMRSMFADSAIFYTDNGSIKNIQEFLDDIAKDASSDTVSTWDMTYVFSVNSDNDTAGGEWVNAGFKVEGSVNDSTIVKNNYIEWYYVIDGKVAEYSSSKRKIKL